MGPHEPLPPGLSSRDARLLRVLVWLVSAPYGEAIAGDLAEIWSAGASQQHGREVLDAVLRSWGALGARVVVRHRVPMAVGATLGLLAHLAAWALWNTILAHVPLRADHPPHLAWMLVTSLIAVASAALGWHLGSASRSRHESPPESLA